MTKTRKQKQMDQTLTRNKYKETGAKPLKWMPGISDVDRPLSKEDSLRYIKSTNQQLNPLTKEEKNEPETSQSTNKDTGSPATRNRYKLGGGEQLHWIQNINETDRPLTKDGSVRYIKQQQASSEEVDNNDDANEETCEDNQAITRNKHKLIGGKQLKWIKNINETEKPLTNEGSVRYKREIGEEESLSEVDVEVSKSVTFEKDTKRKSPRTAPATKKIKLDEIPITRNMGEKLREEHPTRNRYKLGGGPALEWMRDINEVDKPLTKHGSMRYETEKSKLNKLNQIKAKKLAEANKNLIESDTEDKSDDNSEEAVVGSRVTRNRHIMAGEKQLKWLKNVNETDRPLSKEDSVRYQNELKQQEVLPSLRYKNKISKQPVLAKRQNIVKGKKAPIKDAEPKNLDLADTLPLDDIQEDDSVDEEDNSQENDENTEDIEIDERENLQEDENTAANENDDNEKSEGQENEISNQTNEAVEKEQINNELNKDEEEIVTKGENEVEMIEEDTNDKMTEKDPGENGVEFIEDTKNQTEMEKNKMIEIKEEFKETQLFNERSYSNQSLQESNKADSNTDKM